MASLCIDNGGRDDAIFLRRRLKIVLRDGQRATMLILTREQQVQQQWSLKHNYSLWIKQPKKGFRDNFATNKLRRTVIRCQKNSGKPELILKKNHGGHCGVCWCVSLPPVAGWNYWSSPLWVWHVDFSAGLKQVYWPEQKLLKNESFEGPSISFQVCFWSLSFDLLSSNIGIQALLFSSCHFQNLVYFVGTWPHPSGLFSAGWDIRPTCFKIFGLDILLLSLILAPMLCDFEKDTSRPRAKCTFKKTTVTFYVTVKGQGHFWIWALK